MTSAYISCGMSGLNARLPNSTAVCLNRNRCRLNAALGRNRMPLVDEMLYVEVWCTYAEMEVDMSKSGAMILNQ